MSSVLRNFSPKVLWLSVIPPHEDLAKLLAEARGLGIRVEQHFDGDEFPFGGTSALTEGDAEALSEGRMVERDPAATPEFSAAVHPRCSVISVGMGNPFGLPKMDMLERLEDRHVTTYRTDMDGAVTFFLDGARVAEGRR